MTARFARIVLFSCVVAALSAVQAQAVSPIAISSNGRHLTKDGNPWLLLGDTGWRLCWKNTRAQAKSYIDETKGKGFNTIFVLFAEKSTGNNVEGYAPFNSWSDPSSLTDAYWKYWDEIIPYAESKGMYVAANVVWAQDVNGWTDAESYTVGKLVGSRYKSNNNIIWMTCGEGFESTESKVGNLGKGIGDNAPQIITVHGVGDKSAGEWFQSDSWYDFNAVQCSYTKIETAISGDWNRSPTKPTFLQESWYEFGEYSGITVGGAVMRGEAYISIFRGGMGYGYGCHGVWDFTSYSSRKDCEGRSDMQWVAKLMNDRSNNLNRIPANDKITAGNTGRVAACRDNNSWIMAYIPDGHSITVNTGFTGSNLQVRWYDPRNGTYSTISDNIANTGSYTSSAKSGGDWVLVITSNGTAPSTPAAPALSSPANGATDVSVSPTISWGSSSGATSYGLQVSTSSSFTSTTVNQAGLTATSYNVSGLNEAVTYYWRVNATNSVGTSGWSTSRSFTTASSGNTSLTISNITTASGKAYVLDASLANGDLLYIDRSFTYTSVGIFAGMQNIRTANDDKAGTLSSTLSFSVSAPTTVYVAFDSRATKLPGWMSGWTNTGETVGTSDYARNVYSKGFSAGSVTLGGNERTLTDAQSMYTVLVAPDDDGSTPPVPAAPTLASPAEGATDVSASATLTWNASSGAQSYALQVSTSSSFSGTVVNQTGLTSTSYATSGLSEDMTYYWRVNATNSAGTSTWSGARSFSTAVSGGTTLSVTNIKASSGKAYKPDVSLAVGDSVYIDRNYTYTSVGTYAGMQCIRTANGDKAVTASNGLTFSISIDAVVYVAYDVRATKLPSWLSGWTNTGTSVGTSDVSHKMYSKAFGAGTVILGGNEGSSTGAGSMYTVFVKSSLGKRRTAASVFDGMTVAIGDPGLRRIRASGRAVEFTYATMGTRPVSLQVFSLDGAKLADLAVQSTRGVHIAKWSTSKSGRYVLRATIDGKSTVRKFVVMQ